MRVAYPAHSLEKSLRLPYMGAHNSVHKRLAQSIQWIIQAKFTGPKVSMLTFLL